MSLQWSGVGVGNREELVSVKTRVGRGHSQGEEGTAGEEKLVSGTARAGRGHN